MSTRDWYWRANYWTYSMMYGPGLPMPPSTLSHTSGLDSEGFSLTPFSTWFKTTIGLLIGPLWTRLQSYFRRYQWTGAHRGTGRQTRTSARRIRTQTQTRRANFQAYKDLLDKSTVGVAQLSEPVAVPRVYRKLAWSRLSHEARQARRRFFPEDPYDSVP